MLIIEDKGSRPNLLTLLNCVDEPLTILIFVSIS
jgi:hypothetical protein